MSRPIWDSAPLAFFRMPSCPFCGSPDRITVRSTRESDGSITRRTICRSCSQRYVLVLEAGGLPEFGSVAGATE